MTLGECYKWFDSAVTLLVSGNWESLSIAQAIALFVVCCFNAILLVGIIWFIWNVVVFLWEEFVADFIIDFVSDFFDFSFLFIFVVIIVIFFIFFILLKYV